MTYMNRTVNRRYRRPQHGLSGWLEDLTRVLGGKPSEEVECLNAANEAMAPVDAKITDLAKNWNPTGFYTPADIRKLVSSTMMVVQQGQAAIDAAAREPNASQESIMRATNDLARAGSRSIDYLQAASDSDGQGLRAVNAAGMKRWVTDTMATASSAMVTASVIGCIRPWWVSALATFQAVFNMACSVALGIGGVVLAVGETALKVVGDLPQIWEVAKWVGLAAGAYWIWTEINDRRRTSE